jgi:ribosomal protein L37AE/L43A
LLEHLSSIRIGPDGFLFPDAYHRAPASPIDPFGLLSQRPDLAAAHRELAARLEDLRRCPSCGRLFLERHASQIFHAPRCRTAWHRALAALRGALRDELGSGRSDVHAIARLRADISRHEREITALKRKRP